jgi:hypothetical protein
MTHPGESVARCLYCDCELGANPHCESCRRAQPGESVTKLTEPQYEALLDMRLGEMPFSGAELITCRNLVAKGFAVECWDRFAPPRCFAITEAGREALNDA